MLNFATSASTTSPVNFSFSITFVNATGFLPFASRKLSPAACRVSIRPPSGSPDSFFLLCFSHVTHSCDSVFSFKHCEYNPPFTFIPRQHLSITSPEYGNFIFDISYFSFFSFLFTLFTLFTFTLFTFTFSFSDTHIDFAASSASNLYNSAQRFIVSITNSDLLILDDILLFNN